MARLSSKTPDVLPFFLVQVKRLNLIARMPCPSGSADLGREAMSERNLHFKALTSLYLSSTSDTWSRPNVELGSGYCSISVRLTPLSNTPWGVVKESVVFQLLHDASQLADNTQETSLLAKCDKFELQPFQALWESRVTAVARVIHSGLHQWNVESTIYDEAEKEIAWARSWFSRSNVLLETIAPYKNHILKLNQDWS
jgi:hypothetical protein